MAFYINDKEIIEFCLTQEGIGLIMSFMNTKEDNVRVVKIPNENKIIIQSLMRGLGNKRYWINSVGIPTDANDMYINPVTDDFGNNYTKELYEFILSEIPAYIRDRKISNMGIV